MPGKKRQHTRRLKGGDKKNLEERRAALNKQLATFTEEEKNATERGAPTALLKAMIRDLQAQKKYLNRSETRAAERAAKMMKKAVSSPNELNAAANAVCPDTAS